MKLSKNNATQRVYEHREEYLHINQSKKKKAFSISPLNSIHIDPLHMDSKPAQLSIGFWMDR
uniref:Uncharacterized protein n=1 Tax=Utricularia reniformis TaxID=192314 RepID=A0A1Y0B0H8_9LAMI|nr:hypothetical protein AEK19_MT0647 [Utricularia reniformis]ART30900.1 hypothetical protein AEK19_MT0647 [Utricularia reniformis]